MIRHLISLVSRATAAKHFMESEIWKALQASPKEVICKLLGKKLHRSEGWKLVSDDNSEQLLVGYATYIAADAQQVQEASGRNGIFVEALARDQPARPMVTWLPPGDTTGIAYLRSALQQAGGRPLAFRKGQGASIGIRAKRGEAVKAASNWRVRGVPRAWSEQDLLDALQGADFQEVQVVSEAHGSRPWLVRATLAADTGKLALIVEAGSKLLRVERVVGQARTSRFEERPWTPAKARQGGRQREACSIHAIAHGHRRTAARSRVTPLSNPKMRTWQLGRARPTRTASGPVRETRAA